MRALFLSIPAALLVAGTTPAPAGAQRIGRTTAQPPVVSRPAAPRGQRSGATVFRGSVAGPRRTATSASGAPIGRTYLPRRKPPRTETGASGGIRGGCVGGLCRCFGGARCKRAPLATIPFGFSLFDSYAVPYAVPYPVPVPVPSAGPIYGAHYVRREREADTPPRRPAPGKSRMIVVDSLGDPGRRSVKVEAFGDTLVRLTWVGSPAPSFNAREAELFVADSARHVLRSRRVDATSPVATIHVRGLRQRVAYAGVSVELAHGTILTTLVPMGVEVRRTPPSQAR